jgi:hypothetical protein
MEFHKIAQNEAESESEQEEHEVLALIEVAEQSPLGNKAHHSDDKRRQNQGKPEARGTGHHLGDAECRESSDHVKGPVGNIGNPQNAENKAQAGAHDKQNHGSAQPDEKLTPESA